MIQTFIAHLRPLNVTIDPVLITLLTLEPRRQRRGFP